MKIVVSLLFILLFFATAITQSPNVEVESKQIDSVLIFPKEKLVLPDTNLLEETEKLNTNLQALQTVILEMEKDTVSVIEIDSIGVITKKSWIKRVIEKLKN